MIGIVSIDNNMKKVPDYSVVTDCAISNEVQCQDFETGVGRKDWCLGADHIKLERNFDDTIDIKYEDFEYDLHGHTSGEDHTMHPNGVFPHTPTQSMVKNIPMEVGNVKKFDTNLVAVEKRIISRESIINCNICQKSFPWLSDLDRHMRSVHMREKGFFCDICHISFSQNSKLSRHVKSVHEGEKPFFCDICHNSFSRKSNLSQHLKSVHEGEKPFTCDICHSSFSQKSDLSRHLKSVHEGEKPFSCDICHSSFSAKSKLSQHVRAVHEGEKPFSHEISHHSFSH